MTDKNIAQSNKLKQDARQGAGNQAMITGGQKETTKKKLPSLYLVPPLETIFKGPTDVSDVSPHGASNEQRPPEVDEATKDAEGWRLAKKLFWPGKTDAEIEQEIREEQARVLAPALEILAARGVRLTPIASEPPSDPSVDEVLARFLHSRKVPREGCRGTRDGFYAVYLPRAIAVLGLRPTPFHIESFIKSLADPDRKPKPCSPGGQKAYFVAVRALYNWLYSKRSPYENFKPEDNPFHRDNDLKPPDVPNRNLPRQTEESVLALMAEAGKGEHPVRDQALLAIYIESGARLREVAGINEPEVMWAKRQFRATIKGGDEKFYGFGPVGESLLRDWLVERPPNGGNIWGLKWAGIRQVFRRLEERTGIKCNAHSFRRGFACIQRERGVDSADIMTLGNWRSIQMVLRYTKSIDFDNAQRRYREPLRLQTENPRVPSSILGLGTSQRHIDLAAISSFNSSRQALRIK